MKTQFLATGLLALGIMMSNAGLKLPSWVFEASELEEAMAEAAEEGKGLGFVLTDLNTT